MTYTNFKIYKSMGFEFILWARDVKKEATNAISQL